MSSANFAPRHFSQTALLQSRFRRYNTFANPKPAAKPLGRIDMFSTDAPSLSALIISAALAYLIGALPIADRLSRRSGVNIFESGTGLAGATNVLKTVGKLPAIFVFIGDMAKGVVVVFAAQRLFEGIDGVWIVVPVAAAVIGQWNSVFSRFKGGDGLVVLGGATIIAFPEYAIGFIGVACAAAIASVAQRMPFSSLFNIPIGYGVIIGLSNVMGLDVNAPIAMGCLGVAVFGHALLGHARRRRSSADEEDSDVYESKPERR